MVDHTAGEQITDLGHNTSKFSHRTTPLGEGDSTTYELPRPQLLHSKMESRGTWLAQPGERATLGLTECGVKAPTWAQSLPI